jgi:hypothetical protein
VAGLAVPAGSTSLAFRLTAEAAGCAAGRLVVPAPQALTASASASASPAATNRPRARARKRIYLAGTDVDCTLTVPGASCGAEASSSFV